jgi:hypothetical protein
LLYLTSATWTSGEVSAQFAHEIVEAHRLGVHLLPMHEFPSMMDDARTSQRRACDFNEFWNDGWTPKHLLKGDANVYKQIAMALKPGEWRDAGLMAVLDKMRTFDGTRTVIYVDPCDIVTADEDRVSLIDVTDSPPSESEDTSLTRPQSHHNAPGRMLTDEVELTSISTAIPLPLPELNDDSAEPLPRASTSWTRRRSADIQDEMRMFGSCGSREYPPSRRETGGNSQVRNPASQEFIDQSRVTVVGRARADSLAEDPTACWVPVRPSLSAPGASEGRPAHLDLCA